MAIVTIHNILGFFRRDRDCTKKKQVDCGQSFALLRKLLQGYIYKYTKMYLILWDTAILVVGAPRGNRQLANLEWPSTYFYRVDPIVDVPKVSSHAVVILR